MFEGGLIKKLGAAKKNAEKKAPDVDMDKVLKKDNPQEHKHSINRILGAAPPKKAEPEENRRRLKKGVSLFQFSESETDRN